MIRVNFLIELRRRLTSPPMVVPEDFGISVEPSREGTALVIEYFGDGISRFVATVPHWRGGRMTAMRDVLVNATPGAVAETEYFMVADEDGLLEEVEAWRCRLIGDSVEGMAAALQMEDARQADETDRARTPVLAQSATLEQVTKLTELLNDLEARLRQHLEKTALGAAERARRSEALGAEFATLRARLTTTEGRRFLRAALAPVSENIHEALELLRQL